jgi:hypothetical protein
MTRNEEITALAEEIMLDITNNRIPLHSALLKASRLSLLIDMPKNVDLFKEWAKYAEQNSFVVETYKSTIESAKDRDVAISSANPHQIVYNSMGNFLERNGIRSEAKNVVGYLAKYRTEAYNFASQVFTKWRFGNVAESVFEKKRKRVEPILREIFPDADQRLNSIEQNIASHNSEDWKNAVISCRTLFMDIADIFSPAKPGEDKKDYINRLKDFVSPKITGETKKNLLDSLFEELKNRIEFTAKLTQGSAHMDRPTLTDSENIVLYTYLVISELIEIYSSRKNEI